MNEHGGRFMVAECENELRRKGDVVSPIMMTAEIQDVSVSHFVENR